MTYVFGPFELNAQSRRLSRDGAIVPVPDRHLEVLLQLVSRGGQVVSKDSLISAVWNDVAVTDNSLEQAISALRRTLGVPPTGPATYIETLPRRGYRFAVPTTTVATRHSDEALASLLAPYRALVDGRAALETLDREAVRRACTAFEEITRVSPDYAPAHLGLANALALMLESVRADRDRDHTLVTRALHHASEACRLDPASGEAWATLSLLAHQSRDHPRAIAAAQRATALEPDNWRHHLRLAYASWGEARLRAAHRVLNLLPEFPLAHWLAATVHVARQALGEAEHELVAGAAAQDRQPQDAAFKGVGLHLLLGLVRLASGDEGAAVDDFQREVAAAPSRHVYGREACANSWCALAAVHWRHADQAEAQKALEHAATIIPSHPLVIAAAAALRQPTAERDILDARLLELRQHGATVEAAIAEAVYDTLLGDPARAARLTQTALEHAPGGSAGWTIPVEPLLYVGAHRTHWQAVLTLLRSRAA
jgi:DNA-binding winged helix-turn-helix (wHTH) protein